MDTAMLKDIAGSYGIFCALFIMINLEPHTRDFSHELGDLK